MGSLTIGLIGFLMGGAVGAIILYAILNSRVIKFQTEKQAADEALKTAQTHYEQRLKDNEINEKQLKDSFSVMAQEVLTKNLELQLKALQTQNTTDLDKKKLSFDQSFEEIKTSLKDTSEKIHLFEKERVDQYSKIEKQIQTISEQEVKLIQETERLKSALTTSQSVRGRWGEMVLRNILEQSDLVSGIDFNEQATSFSDEGAALKPDFVINLPQSGQHLVIDSKASIFDSYLESEQTKTEAGRQMLHKDFVVRLRDRVKELSGKEYQKFVVNSLPYVVLFIPSEAAIRAAFDVDPELFKWSMDRKVFIASPATILPLIMLIGHAWKQYHLSERATELSHVVETLGSRLDIFVKRLSKVQGGLEQATRAWNEAIDKSWNGQQSVTKSIEKARELGGNISEIVELTPIESAPRSLE